MYSGKVIKQYEVKHIRCILGQSVAAESMASIVLKKVNLYLKFLPKQSLFSRRPLHRRLCNAQIQPLFIRLAHLGFLKKNKIMYSSVTK